MTGTSEKQQPHSISPEVTTAASCVLLRLHQVSLHQVSELEKKDAVFIMSCLNACTMSCRTGRKTYHLLQPPVTLMSRLRPDTQLLRFYLPRCLHPNSMFGPSDFDVQDLSFVAKGRM